MGGMWRTAALASLAGTALALTSPGATVDRPARDRPAAAPLVPDGLLVIAALSPERVIVADPRTGRTTERELPGGTLCHGPLLAAGDRMLVFGADRGRVVPRLLPLRGRGPARVLPPAETVFESSTAGRLWLGRWTRQEPRMARIELREVDAAGRVFARASWAVPRWSSLIAVMDDGSLLITRGRGLVLRRRDGTRRLFRGGWPLATAGDRFAWHRAGSPLVRVWSSAGERSLEPPPGMWPEEGPPGAFSPDGKRLALPVKARGRSHAAVIELTSGAWRLVPGGRVSGYRAIAWSPSGRWLYFSRGDRVLASRGGTARAVRLPIRTRGTVMSIVSGSSRDVTPERPAAGPARLGRRPEGIPLGFRGSRTTHGGDRRSPISGGTLREGPLSRP